jgi:hypothetical protein
MAGATCRPWQAKIWSNIPKESREIGCSFAGGSLRRFFFRIYYRKSKLDEEENFEGSFVLRFVKESSI